MKDLILGIIYVIAFIFIVGSVGANEWGDITSTELAIRGAVTFAILFVLTLILNDDIKEVIADKWRKKKHLKIKSKRF